jgi:hypothetical protein
MKRAWIGILALGLSLRLWQAALRWDEVALAYSAYPWAAVLALRSGDLAGALGSWVGLHPPLFSLIASLAELWMPVPALILGGSAAMSALAVGAVAREDRLAGLALATCPAAVLYAGEWNNYPLAAGLVGLTLALVRARWGLFALAVVAAGWAHLLAGIGALGLLAWRLANPRGPGERARLVAAVGLGLLPIGVGALRLLGEPSTFSQPEGGLFRWLEGLWALCGGPALALAGLALIGLRGAARWGLGAAGGFYGLTLALGVSAPHQLPYLSLLVPFVALGCQGLRGLWRAAAVALVVAQGGALALDLAERSSEIVVDTRQERAIDRAVAASAAGDLLWLVSPALLGDDDKRATSAILWRLSPFSWMPVRQTTPFDQTDWRYGQPRGWRGRVVHTSTELEPARFDAVVAPLLAAKGRVFVVLADHGPAAGLEARVRRALRPYLSAFQRFPRQEGLGDDLLWVVEGR